MTAYGVGAVSLAVALGVATALPMWVAVSVIAAAILFIAGMLRWVGGSGRVPALARSAGPTWVRGASRPQVTLPIPRQRGASRLPRAVE